MLVILDVDGTLVGEEGAIPEAVLEAADTLRELGARLSLATGRPAAGVAGRMAERLDPSASHVFLNGALVRTGRGRVVERVPLDADLLGRQVDAAREQGATLELYTARTHYVDECTAPCRRHADLLDLDPEERDLEQVVEEESILKAQWIVPEEGVDAVRGLELPACELAVGTSPLMPEWRFVNVSAESAGKRPGVETAASQVGESLGDAVAVGDGPSDRAVLEAVGHPFAMANAPESLRRDFPTAGDVDDQGVLEVLEYAAQLAYRSG